LSNIFIIFANFLPTLIPFFQKTSALAVATLLPEVQVCGHSKQLPIPEHLHYAVKKKTMKQPYVGGDLWV